MAKVPGEEIWAYHKSKGTEKVFQAHALGIGRAVIAWNDLHEQFGHLFALLCHGADRKQGLAVWSSSESDRAKRQMLKAVLPVAPVQIVERFPLAVSDIEWALTEAISLEETRNNVVHGPVHLEMDIGLVKRDRAAGHKLNQALFLRHAFVAPMIWGGNRRATKLEGKGLLTEYRYCLEWANTIRNFVYDIDCAIDAERPWPKRPKRPIRRHPK